jgi:hypothetical protein
MKYQDPLNPTDSSQFMAQTAQFTELQTMQKMETEQQTMVSSMQTLAASSMVGRQVAYSLAVGGNAAAPTPTTSIAVRGTLPENATTGTQETTSTDVYTHDGTKVPLDLVFTKADSGWTVQASNEGQMLGSPLAISFDSTGDRTSSDLTLPAGALDAITGTTGGWPAAGVALAFGGTNDPTRLAIASGPASVTVAEQNGNDGNTAAGVVTGIRITADGPQLVIGGKNIPLTSITGVQA